jgi:NTE family protein
MISRWARPSTAGAKSDPALAGLLAALLLSACAAPLQRAAPAQAAPIAAPPAAHRERALTRPPLGVALGGGSARGIAHVGVIRWFEEHRIPIDLLAGTSMGGLVGGAFATGMEAAELQAFITMLDWDGIFGDSTFAYKNLRRKADARAYPSRLEFGLRGGLVPPAALNNGQGVEWLLARMAAPYFGVDDFDALPTPFRAVAVDLLSAEPVVIRRGSLADAMRATMSLPLVFPPVEIDGQVLVDGGTMNNVPADVVRAMGAGRVIAVNVGDLSDREGVAYTMLGLANNTINAMMRASTRRALASADVVIDVPLRRYGSLDWRRAAALVEEGYRAAERMRDALLPFAVSDAEFDAWRRDRRARRLTTLPAPAFIELAGFVVNDQNRMQVLLARHLNAPLDTAALENDLAVVSGVGRYETITWRFVHDARGAGLLVRGRQKTYAPPFMMLGVNLQNTTSDDFQLSAAARYLAFDVGGSGAELRVDGTVGSDPGIAAEWYRPVGRSPLFATASAGSSSATFNFIDNDAVVARYGVSRQRGMVGVGVNLGARSDLRAGVYLGRATATIAVGDPGFPELRGRETGADVAWRLDTQDLPVIPTRGIHATVRWSRVFNPPDLSIRGETVATTAPLTQLAAESSRFWRAGSRGRVFSVVSLGTTLAGDAIATSRFWLGAPFQLSSYDAGELTGRHAYAAAGGYFRQVSRLPDFLGGPIFAGAWMEGADAVDRWRDAGVRVNSGAALVMDTLVGPVVVAGAWSYDGRWRTYLGIGRLFR